MTTGLLVPVPGHRISQDFGPGSPLEPDGVYIQRDAGGWIRARKLAFAAGTKRNDVHRGTDYSCPVGTKVLAPEAGKVYSNFYDSNGGYISLLRINASTLFYAGHLSKFIAKIGQKVNRGQLLDLSGDSGLTTGPHCHAAIFHDYSSKHDIHAWYSTWFSVNLERLLVGGDMADRAWLLPD